MTQQEKDLIHPLFIDFGNKICEGGAEARLRGHNGRDRRSGRTEA